MKRRSILLGVVSLALLMPVSSLAYAQSPQTDPKVQYPTEELEQLRGKLIEMVDAVKVLSGLLADNSEELRKLDQARAFYEQFSLKDLNTYRAAMDPAKMNAGLAEARAVIAEYVSGKGGDHRRSSSRRGAALNSANLPDRRGPSSACDDLIGSGRPTSALVISLEAIYYTAKVVHDTASRACNQIAVLVILGEGGGANTSLACTAADVVYLAAEAVLGKVRSCEADFGLRTLDTNYDRLDHIHTDLESSIANDNTNRNAIVANDNTNRDTIVSNDNTNSTAIIANADANRGDIIVNGNTNTATINSATTAAKVELRDLILRTQIEADLAAADSATPVGLYLTPTANGGYLNLVRAIVVQTIANIQAAGGSTGQAQSLLTQGDTFKNAGDFKKAYTYYRKAFKAAGK